MKTIYIQSRKTSKVWSSTYWFWLMKFENNNVSQTWVGMTMYVCKLCMYANYLNVHTSLTTKTELCMGVFRLDFLASWRRLKSVHTFICSPPAVTDCPRCISIVVFCITVTEGGRRDAWRNGKRPCAICIPYIFYWFITHVKTLLVWGITSIKAIHQWPFHTVSKSFIHVGFSLS